LQLTETNSKPNEINQFCGIQLFVR